MNILAIDYGTQKTGLAISKYPNIVAETLPTIFESNIAKLIENITGVIKDNSIELLIIGAPYGPNRTENIQVLKIKEFANTLEKKSGVKYILIDESLTTKNAESISKENSDSIAAAIILQEYLGN